MSETLITCPSCKTEFPLTESLAVLQGIAGRSLQEIEGLTVPALEDGSDGNVTRVK